MHTLLEFTVRHNETYTFLLPDVLRHDSDRFHQSTEVGVCFACIKSGKLIFIRLTHIAAGSNNVFILNLHKLEHYFYIRIADNLLGNLLRGLISDNNPGTIRADLNNHVLQGADS